ncbi:hypothetical protein E2C01_067496 [Portunus trituberculatus]|uniref:Uncharacterized protein n=1 Tax=Portunus trituberculatus TaxID=210409 RepID=A0A5B7HWV9_PORTR|nr:hypothetical protein [Portunus trituberculatus]
MCRAGRHARMLCGPSASRFSATTTLSAILASWEHSVSSRGGRCGQG